MSVLLSIKPKYVEKIFSGEKKYEFRRKIFRRRDINRIYIYSNSNVKKIVGSFEVKRIISDKPENIWGICHRYGGISKNEFFKYFLGAKKGFAIEIKNVHKFYEPIDPYSAIENFTPPQSFYYIDASFFNKSDMKYGE